jgi:hypothetical protein
VIPLNQPFRVDHATRSKSKGAKGLNAPTMAAIA